MPSYTIAKLEPTNFFQCAERMETEVSESNFSGDPLKDDKKGGETDENRKPCLGRTEKKLKLPKVPETNHKIRFGSGSERDRKKLFFSEPPKEKNQNHFFPAVVHSVQVSDLGLNPRLGRRC